MGQIAASPGPDALRQQARAFRDRLLALSDDDFRRQQTATLQTAITDPARLQPAVDWMLTSDRQTIAQAQYEMLTADLRAETTKITAPLLAIGTWRGREPFGFTHAKVEADLTAQYGRVAHHMIVITDTARHFVMLDEPDWLAAQIDGFATR
jgi:pimeloyl-ACP methyl ester carboxylesterase